MQSTGAQVSNSILWGNTSLSAASNVSEEQILDAAAVVTFSDVQGGRSGVGNLDMDPDFIHPLFGDYHLAPDSPCVGAADESLVPSDELDLDGDGDLVEPIPIDLDGNARAQGGVDIGAYEQ